MNEEMKAHWLAALRSGNYKQGQTVLRTKKDEYCCLGVLCDLLEPTAWVDGDPQDHYYHAEGASGFLPDLIRDIAEFDSHNPVIKRENLTPEDYDWLVELGYPIESIEAVPLTWINDQGVSFEKMADLIERYF